MAETHVFQAEIKQLLNILVHSLYTDREIFLRELISNASDALNKIQFTLLTNPNAVDAGAELFIELYVNKEQKTLRLVDTGIGMTHTELIQNLGVIAQSGIKAFLEGIQDKQAVKEQLIGQFGVGFYSVFMVADKVEVTSRSYLPDEPAYRWISTGSDTFEIEPADKTERGTEILIHLREDALDFAEVWKLRETVKRHSDYVAFPIYVLDETAEKPEEDQKPANQQTALWRRSPSEITEEDYHNFYRSLTLDFEAPLLKIHAQGDAPIQYYALLFLPQKAERGMFSLRKEPGLKLYTRKILIQEYTTALLPEYLQFVQGVVDSEDIPLNVNRESVQANPMITKLKQVVTRRVLSELDKLAKNDADKYAQFWGQFGAYLKHGVVSAYEDRERLLPLIRFYSSTSETVLTALEDYVGRMVEGQEAIYYLIADNVGAASRSPHLIPFRERGIEVLYLLESVDGFMVNSLREYKGHKLVSVDAETLDLEGVGQTPATPEEAEPVPQDDLEQLLVRMRTVLGEAVQNVKISKVLTSGSPIRLVTPDGALDRHTQRVYQMLDREFEIPARIVEINPRHRLIRNLAQRLSAGDLSVDKTIAVLYGNALLADGIHPNPSEFAQQIQNLLEEALA